jgi:hypothetical protein
LNLLKTLYLASLKYFYSINFLSIDIEIIFHWFAEIHSPLINTKIKRSYIIWTQKSCMNFILNFGILMIENTWVYCLFLAEILDCTLQISSIAIYTFSREKMAARPNKQRHSSEAASNTYYSSFYNTVNHTIQDIILL